MEIRIVQVDSSPVGWTEVVGWECEREQTRAKTKYRDLSTAQRTVKLSVAPVEMTFVLDGLEERE